MSSNKETFRAQAQTFAARFAALGHVNRVEILRHLRTAHPDGLVVGEIQGLLGIPASTLSHHLEALRQEGLVVQEREGRFLRYRAGTEALNAVLGYLYAECCAGRSAAAPLVVPTISTKVEEKSDSVARRSASKHVASALESDVQPEPGSMVEEEAWKSW